MGTAGRKIGVGIVGVGMALIAAGVFAGGASAGQEGQEGSERLECPSAGLAVSWLDVNLEEVASATGQSFSDGTITVTLANAAPIPGETLSLLTIGSLDFEASRPVDAIELQLWQSPGEYDYDVVGFDPPVKTGHLQSPDGSHPQLVRAPIKGLVFCYQSPPAATTTTSTTTTSTTTTVAVVPDQVVATTTAAPTTVAPVEVLPQVVTAPEQIAFTGSSSGPLVTVGAVLVLLGLSLVGIDRMGFVRRGRHSR